MPRILIAISDATFLMSVLMSSFDAALVQTLLVVLMHQLKRQ